MANTKPQNCQNITIPTVVVLLDQIRVHQPPADYQGRDVLYLVPVSKSRKLCFVQN